MTNLDWLNLFEKRLNENEKARKEFLHHIILGDDGLDEMPYYEYFSYLDLKYNLVSKDDSEYYED